MHAYAVHDPAKRSRAQAVLDHVAGANRGALSTQVLAEVFRVLTARLQPRVPAAEALTHLAHLAQAWPVLQVTPAVVLEAARGVRDHRLSYWDAQIWATARLNQATVILTEDGPHGRLLEGVRYVDPFRPEFDPATLG